MFSKKNNFIYVFIAFCFFKTGVVLSQQIKTIEIDTTNGKSIKRGASGFNVRIADKVWSYTHPDFVKSVKELKPGWLRYFSGTMGDAFSSATGLYDVDYIHMFDHPDPFLKGHRFTDVKGPHRVADLYDLLRQVNGKLVVTVNAFTETPDMIHELAQFCKNNNIEVEMWQFCNEPYFYVPNRNRYWWNDGYDYAAKMEPYAESIKKVFPDAKLALNYTWDGVWTFMKEIHEFQEEHGAYWNVFSKHSYAPHTGKKETLAKAYKRANTKLLEATSDQAMNDIELYSWKDVPMIITEFGVWNKPLNGIYASIYNIEYVMRQLLHSNTEYIAAHEVSNKFLPLNGRGKELENIYKKGLKVDTDTMLTGIRKDLEGKAYEIYNVATNNSEYLYKTSIPNVVQLPGLKNTHADGMFAQTYKGNNGYDYIVVTNRSAQSNQFQLNINGDVLQKDLITTYISADSLNTKDAEICQEVYKKGVLTVKPFSLSVAKWRTKNQKLDQPRIYKSEIQQGGIFLNWGEISRAEKYKVFYGTKELNLNKTLTVSNKTSIFIDGINRNKSYFFKVKAIGRKNESEFSETVSVKYELPTRPIIFKTSRRDNSVTVFWKSVPNTTGYYVNYTNDLGEEIKLDAKNVFGFRVGNLKDNFNYKFYVSAYNGLGEGKSSKKEKVLVSSRVPLSPRNVSATKKTKTSIEVKWHPQKKVLKNTFYNVYRGKKLHEFRKIATGIRDTVFLDNSIKKDIQYYYTVKALTEVGESNFYPNIATTLSLENNNKISIQSIETQEDGYLVKVTLNKINAPIGYRYGLILNNVSYLNVEHVNIEGVKSQGKPNSFQVFIPKDTMKQNSKYSIKAYIVKKEERIESAIVNQFIPKE